MDGPHRHVFFKNRFGDLQCWKCGFKISIRVDPHKDPASKPDMMVSV